MHLFVSTLLAQSQLRVYMYMHLILIHLNAISLFSMYVEVNKLVWFVKSSLVGFRGRRTVVAPVFTVPRHDDIIPRVDVSSSHSIESPDTSTDTSVY